MGPGRIAPGRWIDHTLSLPAINNEDCGTIKSVITKQRFGFSAMDANRSDCLLNLPSHSPLTHGMSQLEITWSDGLVATADPLLGAMHRGAEKLFESRDYRQILGLANRHEWLSAFSGEVGIAQLIERELGIDVPITARWLRTLLLETYRVSSHLAFLAGFTWGNQPLVDIFRFSREPLVNHLRSYTGSRMHPMLTQIGGMTHAPSQNWLIELNALLQKIDLILREHREVIDAELEQYSGLGVLTAESITELAVSGPIARASGVPIDQRVVAKNLCYGELKSFEVITSSAGDTPARINQLLAEIINSISMIQEAAQICLGHLGNEINVLIPKVLRVPEGEYEHSIETPLGIASWYLVSRSDKYPHRLKLRPASLHSALALSKVLVGCTREQLEPVIASMPFLAGDTDR